MEKTNCDPIWENRLNENSVVAFFRWNAFSTHFPLKIIQFRFEMLAMFFNGTKLHCKSISKSFQNIVNAFWNIDNAFDEMAGRLESFIEPLLSAIKIFTTNC